MGQQRKSDQQLLPRIRLRIETIEGIDLLLGVFEKAGQILFPRKIMTAKSSGQITVYSKEEMLQKFENADFIDCRVNAYPLVPKDILQIPNIILIDIDINRSLKTGRKRVDVHLSKTLQKIGEHTCDSIIPLVPMDRQWLSCYCYLEYIKTARTY